MSLRNRLGCNVHQAGEPALRLAASLGVSIVRVDGNMEDLWPAPDRWTHGWLDELLATCQTLGLQVYLTLSHTPSWLAPNRGDLPPMYDWETFCAEIARYYAGRVTYVSCWNEYAGDGRTYADRLLRPMAMAFRAVNAGYQIYAPDIETERDWPQRLTDVITYGADCLDILSVHCYQSTAHAVWESLTARRPIRPGWLATWMPWWTPSIRQVIEAAGWHGPVWLTETGWRSDVTGEDGQAQQWDQLLARFMGSDWLQVLMAFQLLDEYPPDTDHADFGLFRQDGTIKPAGQVLQRYAGRAAV